MTRHCKELVKGLKNNIAYSLGEGQRYKFVLKIDLKDTSKNYLFRNLKKKKKKERKNNATEKTIKNFFNVTKS